MKNLLTILIDRPIGVLSVSALIMILGLVSLSGAPINLFARGQSPSLSIVTNLPDTNSQEMETIVTRKIEDSVSDVIGRKRTYSISRSGESIVTLEFHHGTDIQEASQEVRGRLRRLWKSLPQDTRFPVINRGNPQDAPVLVLAVTSEEGLSIAAEWARSHLKPELSRINGVASVRIAGGPDKEIVVECDPAKLLAINMTTQAVATALSKGFKETPGGAITFDGTRLSIRTGMPEKTPAGISDQPIMVTGNGAVIKVGDIAQVSYKDQEPNEITRFNGKPLVVAAVFKASNHDLRSIWRDCRVWLGSREMSPNSPTVSVIFNQAQELETALNRLVGILPLTLAGTALIIFVFLGSPTPSLTILAAAPFALLSAILVLRLAGAQLDLMSIAGLIMGLGVFVDHSIVVTESIFRRMEVGEPRHDAIINGVSDVAMPLFLSTMATIVVFVPLIFVSHEIKLLFLSFTWSISISLFASLLAALIPTPILCRYISAPSSNSRFQVYRYFHIERMYRKIWRAGLDRPLMFFFVSMIFVFLAVALSMHLKYKQGMASETNGLRILIVTQPGSSKEKTDLETRFIEERVSGIPGVERIYSETNGNQATINIYFPRDIDSGKLSDYGSQIAAYFKERPDVQFHLVNLGTEGEERVISLNVTGPSLTSLMAVERKIRNELTKVDGVKDVIVRQGNLTPVIEFPVFHPVLGHFGIDASEMAHLLRGQLTGPVAAKITGLDRTLQIRVRAQREMSEGLSPVERSIAHGGAGAPIPFMELAQPVGRLEPSELHRENGRPVLRLTLLTDDTDVLSMINRVDRSLSHALDKGFDFSFGEETKDVQRIRREMISAGILGIALIYLILVAATESFIKPMAILAALPFALSGAVIALYLSSTPVALPVYVGLIMLSGLVLNANIVMVHTINDFEGQGLSSEQAIFQGAMRRLRPILMTVLAAIFGVMPMVLDSGAGSNMWGPFALTISSGMAGSCLFALILTPLALLGLNKARQFLLSKLITSRQSF